MVSVALRGAFSRKSIKVDSPRCVCNNRKPPPPRLPAIGVHDGQGKAGGHGGIHRVAACAQHLKPGIRGQVVHADYHAVPRPHRLFVPVRQTRSLCHPARPDRPRLLTGTMRRPGWPPGQGGNTVDSWLSSSITRKRPAHHSGSKASDPERPFQSARAHLYCKRDSTMRNFAAIPVSMPPEKSKTVYRGPPWARGRRTISAT